MSVDVGDRIEVTSNVLGVPPRFGEVLSRSGGTGLQVRWDDGSETVFVPAGNCRVVSHHDRERGDVVELGCRVDVTITEADDECRATASVDTSRGRLRAEGIARRNPADPQIPMIGEELALGRALESLGEQLISAANDHLSRPPSPQEHLVG
jgi:hypothetical protein